MSKVITFSRFYPSYHPKRGQQTFFVEKVVKSFMKIGVPIEEIDALDGWDDEVFDDCSPKNHTIRAGGRFKVGDKFSPRVWSGRPYHTTQIVLAEDVEIKKIWKFSIIENTICIDGKFFYENHVSEWHSSIEKLAENDGLTTGDLFAWFKMPCMFEGQIICWEENINY